ncbi:MAG: radical SAM protein [Nanoarchaeota archaeon]
MKKFNLQWHITAECDQNCAHCYITDSRTYNSELEQSLSLSSCKEVIDSHVEFSVKVGAQPNILFTGGDPLLRKDFFEIAGYAHDREVTFSLLGNPYHLSEETISKLKSLDIKGYQLSIGGLAETHDFFRKKGSFDASIKAIHNLTDAGIKTVVMYTLSRKNAQDLLPVMELVSDLSVNVFAFARICNFGNGTGLDSFTASEYRNILLQVYDKEKQLAANGSKTRFNKKDHLWVPLLKELGVINCEKTSDKLIYSGCSIGISGFNILADGTAFACRRFYSPVGKVPEQSIEDIFFSEKLNAYREANFEKCSPCELFQYCRGCPAVAYNQTGKFGSPDPQCWR